MDYNTWLIDNWNTRVVPFLYSDDWIKNARRLLTWSYTLTTSESVVNFGVETFAMNKAEDINRRWNEMRNGIYDDWFEPSIDILKGFSLTAWLGSLIQMGWNTTEFGLNTVVEMATGQLDSFDISGTLASANQATEE